MQPKKHAKPPGAQGGKPHKHRKDFAAVSLQKFGAIGKSTYDPRAKKAKEQALNAARVNAYRKLQKKLGKKLEPQLKLDQELYGDQEEGLQAGRTGPGSQAVQQDAHSGQQRRQAQQPGRQRQRQPPPGGHHDNFESDGDSESEGGDGEGERGGGDGKGDHQHVRQQDEEQQQQQQQQWRQHPSGRGAGAGRGGGGGGRGGGRGADGGRGRGHKPLSHLQRIAAEAQERKAAEQAAREEAQRQREARTAKLAADAKKRAEKSKVLRKKTGHGQPVMKYRVEQMLAQLQGS